ncbi:MAG TPA: hypothetical protein VFE03_00680 [Caulobacteraceae bacterium]|nr:hypothetical protein [Caulobacteraceae bacterium]
MKGLLAAAALLALSAAPAQAQPACRWVHGRLFAANGNPTFRIAVAGRILGVRLADDQGLADLPAPLPRLMAPDAFAVDVVADFRVCPITRARPGRMRAVRLLAVAKAAARPSR